MHITDSTQKASFFPSFENSSISKVVAITALFIAIIGAGVATYFGFQAHHFQDLLQSLGFKVSVIATGGAALVSGAAAITYFCTRHFSPKIDLSPETHQGDETPHTPAGAPEGTSTDSADGTQHKSLQDETIVGDLPEQSERVNDREEVVEKRDELPERGAEGGIEEADPVQEELIKNEEQVQQGMSEKGEERGIEEAKPVKEEVIESKAQAQQRLSTRKQEIEAKIKRVIKRQENHADEIEEHAKNIKRMEKELENIDATVEEAIRYGEEAARKKGRIESKAERIKQNTEQMKIRRDLMTSGGSDMDKLHEQHKVLSEQLLKIQEEEALLNT